jgi:four helix bundle protein
MRENETEVSMNYQEWLKSVPPELTGDPLWKLEVYRLALFAADLGWRDVSKLVSDKRTLDLSGQLYRAIGSMGANVSEGYSRGTGKDRARFYEYSLGSARESRGWYFNGRFVLGEGVARHRLKLITQIIRLLLTMIPDQRGSELRENGPAYLTEAEYAEFFATPSPAEITDLLQNVPLP